MLTIQTTIIGALAGLLAGSFIATVATRCPRGESALSGRSRCDRCGQLITASGLIPLVSFAVQRGRARCCGARIDPLHPIAEATAALIGAVGGALPLAAGFAAATFGWLLLTLALVDARTLRLPNVLIVLLAAAGLAASAALDAPHLVDSVIGTGAGFASLAGVRLLYRRIRGREGLGRGDPKLFAAIGAWVGWQPLPTVLLLGALAGLLSAACLRLAGRGVGWSDRMPLGTLLALAAWPTWLWWIAGGPN